MGRMIQALRVGSMDAPRRAADGIDVALAGHGVSYVPPGGSR
jgi:hypothetical protein